MQSLIIKFGRGFLAVPFSLGAVFGRCYKVACFFFYALTLLSLAGCSLTPLYRASFDNMAQGPAKLSLAEGGHHSHALRDSAALPAGAGPRNFLSKIVISPAKDHFTQQIRNKLEILLASVKTGPESAASGPALAVDRWSLTIRGQIFANSERELFAQDGEFKLLELAAQASYSLKSAANLALNSPIFTSKAWLRAAPSAYGDFTQLALLSEQIAEDIAQQIFYDLVLLKGQISAKG